MSRISLFIILILLFGCGVSYAGDIKQIRIKYEYVSDNPNETPEQAEKHALEKAKLKAMEDNFGLDVISLNTIVQQNNTQGETTDASTGLFAMSETVVKGEWIETISEDILSKSFERGFWHVVVFVEGKARNHSKPKPEIRYAFVNNSHDRENRDNYYDGDDIYLRFSSPVSGYVFVYLVDVEENVYCLLPYQSSQLGSHHVDANTDYLFFSLIKDENADEYILNTQRSQEQNILYLIFTPNPVTKSSDIKGGENWQGLQLPRQLSYKDFLSWLSTCQTNDEDMVVLTNVITIRKTDSK